jgi:hypothetical protein
MNSERDPRTGQVPLSPSGPDTEPADDRATGTAPGFDSTTTARTQGLRRVRRMSNWTAAALIVGTGASAVALAHHAAVPVPPPANLSTPTTSGVGASSVSNVHGGPQVSHSVATTSASGVTTTTTTRVVNGHAVVTQVRHAPPHHDD